MQGFKGEQGFMKVRRKYAVLLIVISLFLICLLTGFVISGNTNTETYVVGNNVAELDGRIYYISGRKLMVRHGNTDEELYSNVSAIQKYNDYIYFIAAEENTEKNLLYTYDGEAALICELPTGYGSNLYCYDNYLYYLIDGVIYKTDLRDFTSSELVIDGKVSDFCICKDKIFYWCGYYKNLPNSFDDYVDQLAGGTDNITVDSKLYTYDLKSEKKQLVYETETGSSRIMLSATDFGELFYNPDEKKLYIHRNSVSTLLEDNIINLVSNGNYIYYLKPNGDVYEMELKKEEKRKVCTNVKALQAIVDNMIYCGDGEFREMQTRNISE